MHRIVICGLSSSAVFFRVINGTTFEKKLLNIKCVLNCSILLYCSELLILSETFLILRRIQQDIRNVYWP